MNVGVFLNYVGLGSNILHLTYCHEIAKKYGPVTIITLSFKEKIFILKKICLSSINDITGPCNKTCFFRT